MEDKKVYCYLCVHHHSLIEPSKGYIRRQEHIDCCMAKDRVWRCISRNRWGKCKYFEEIDSYDPQG